MSIEINKRSDKVVLPSGGLNICSQVCARANYKRAEKPANKRGRLPRICAKGAKYLAPRGTSAARIDLAGDLNTKFALWQP